MEVEDEESDMMVIKTKTIVLEDDLKAAKKQKEELQKVKDPQYIMTFLARSCLKFEYELSLSSVHNVKFSHF